MWSVTLNVSRKLIFVYLVSIIPAETGQVVISEQQSFFFFSSGLDSGSSDDTF